MFKNLLIYSINPSWNKSATELSELLGQHQFVPCSPSESKKVGWVPPIESKQDNFVLANGSHFLLTLCSEEKLVAGSVLKRMLIERCQALEAQQGYKPGRKQRNELKEAIRSELLVSAQGKRRNNHIWIDTENHLLCIEATTVSKADEIVSALIKAAENMPLSQIRTSLSPAVAMTNWLVEDESPEGFTVDRDCELRSRGENAAAVRYSNYNLDGEDIKAHISSGKEPTRLAMTWNDRLSFILTDAMHIKRLSMLDIVLDSKTEQTEGIDPQETDFVILSGELSQFLPALFEALGGIQKEDEKV